jgi:hypothetical protein
VELIVVGIAVLGLGGWTLWRWYRHEREERREEWRRKAVESVERRLEELGKKPPEDRPELRGVRRLPADVPGAKASREVAGAKKKRDVLGVVTGLGLAVLLRLYAKPKRSGRG